LIQSLQTLSLNEFYISFIVFGLAFKSSCQFGYQDIISVLMLALLYIAEAFDFMFFFDQVILNTPFRLLHFILFYLKVE